MRIRGSRGSAGIAGILGCVLCALALGCSGGGARSGSGGAGGGGSGLGGSSAGTAGASGSTAEGSIADTAGASGSTVGGAAGGGDQGGGISGTAGAGGATMGAGGAGGGDLRPAALASCRAYCQRLATDCPTSAYGGVEACQEAECYQTELAPPPCLPFDKAFHDCGLALANLCPGAFVGCAAENKALDGCIGAPYQCPASPPSDGCVWPLDGWCFTPAEMVYECDHSTGTWQCPGGRVPASSHDCSKVKQCMGAMPTSGCSSASQGTCYHDPIGYECDYTTGEWSCPIGAVPAPQHYCAGTGGVSGGGGGPP